MFDHLIGFIGRELRDWDHRATAGLGLVASLAQPVEVATRLLGLVALAVGIYCSIAREIRERRGHGQSRGPQG